MSWQVPDALSVQLVDAKLPPPLVIHETAPLGVLVVPMSESTTLAVHVVVPPAFRVDGAQITVVVVERLVIVSMPGTSVLPGLVLGLKLEPPL